MSPAFVVYIGFVVAVLVLLWGMFELSKRYTRRKKVDVRTINTWQSLNPSLDITPSVLSPTSESDDEEEEDEASSDATLRSRAQQNGHYSESKKPL